MTLALASAISATVFISAVGIAFAAWGLGVHRRSSALPPAARPALPLPEPAPPINVAKLTRRDRQLLIDAHQRLTRRR